MARPKKEINWELIKKKIEAGCSAKEIYNSYEHKMDDDTFYYRFKEEFGCGFQDYSGKQAQQGEGDLKYMLHAKAMQGNITALIFLARCRLGMKEPEISSLTAPLQDTINLQHENMILKHENQKLKELVLNSANKS